MPIYKLLVKMTTHLSTNDKAFTLLLISCCFTLFETSGASSGTGSGGLEVEVAEEEGEGVFRDVWLEREQVWLGEQTVFRCSLSPHVFLSDYDLFVEWPYGIWSTKFAQQLSNIYDIQNATHREIGKVIYQADYKDDGVYSCRATTVDSPIHTQTRQKTLTVLSSTKAVTLSPTGSHLTLQEGARQRVTCLAELANPAASLLWTVGQQPLNESSSSPLFHISPSIVTGSGSARDPRKSSESTVEVTGSTVLHNQQLSCRAKSEADPDYVIASTRLNILYEPRVRVQVKGEAEGAGEGEEEGGSQLIHPLDQRVQLQCVADANPVPTLYSWSLDNSPLPQSPQLQQSLVTVEVSQLMGKQSVSCSATNTINGQQFTGQASATLNFAKPPVFVTRPLDQKVKEGEPFELSCLAQGQPSPSLTWTRHANRHDVIHTGGTVSVDSAQKSDQGQYTCVATSPGFPAIEASATILVFGAPVVFLESRVYGQVGETLSLECTVDASVVAPSYVEWQVDGVTLPDGPFQRYVVQRQQSGGEGEGAQLVSVLLTISPLTEADFAGPEPHYNCTAHNEAGVTSKALLLLPQQTTTGESGVPESLVIIMASGGVATLILLLILVIVCVCCCCRIRNSKSQQPSPLNVEVKPNQRVMSAPVASGLSSVSLDCCSSAAASQTGGHYSRHTSLDRAGVGAVLVGGNRYPGVAVSSGGGSGGAPAFIQSQHPPGVLSPDHDPYNEDAYYKLQLQSQHLSTDGTPQFVHVMNSHRNSLPISTSPLNQLNSSQQIFLDPESQSVQYSSIKPSYVPSHHVMPSDQIDMPIMLLGAAKPNRASPIQFFPRSNTIECFGDGNYSSIGLGSDRSYNSDDLRNKFRAHIPLEIDSGLGSSVQESPPIATTTLLQLANQQEQRALNPLVECSANPIATSGGGGGSSTNVMSTITPIRRPLKPPPYDSNQNSPCVTSSLSRQAKTVSVGSMDHIARSNSVTQDIGGVSGMVRGGGGERKQSVSTFKPKNHMGASNRSLNRVDEIFDPATDSLPGVLRSEFQSDIRSPNEPCLMSPSRLLHLQQQHMSQQAAQRQQEMLFARSDSQQLLVDSQAQSKRPPRSAIAQQRPLQVPTAASSAAVARGRQSSDSSDFSESTVRQPNEKPPSGSLVGGTQMSNAAAVRRKPSVKNKVRFCDEDTTSYPTDADVEDSDFSDISSSYANQAQERSMLDQPQHKNNIISTDISNSPNKSFALV